MLESLFTKHPEYLFLLGLTLGGTLIALTAIVAHHWRRLRQAELDATLKRDMLTRGLSVEEIERVLRASSAMPESGAAPSKPETITDNEYALVEKLVDEGKSGDEIERIIRALKANPEPAPARENPGVVAARESGWHA